MVTFRRGGGIIFLIVCLALSAAPGFSQEREPDVYWVPTPEDVVMKILQTARVTSNDVVYDLGCGDGRIVITAAKMFGARGVGIDIDPVRIQASRENARKAGVENRVKFIQADLFKTDLREATVVTLYLLSELNLRLRPKLFQELKPGARILSHEFDMGDWKPDDKGIVANQKLYYNAQSPEVKDTEYFYWILPADVAGLWRWSLPAAAGPRDYALRLEQTFQEVRGEMKGTGSEGAIADPSLVGDQLRFTFNDGSTQPPAVMRFRGRVTGNTIQGELEVQGGPSSGKYDWAAKR